ncbi:RIP metalloprotease RseP [Floccifex sp.]|uniref:RIP metalloprotease RseP n=1 Tax=Floccifex sp. TaxID=2815810 RepID=UPI003F0B9C2A
MIALLAFVFMLSFIVVIHELGHFLVARHFGVYCHEFSIGMGPLLYQRKGKQTLFSIRAIPFGGYVTMAGEEDGSQDESLDWLKEVKDEQRLNHKPFWQQVCVMIAGVVMNVILAWIMMVSLTMARGYVVDSSQPVIYQVQDNSNAQMAGLQEEDVIVKGIAGKKEMDIDSQSDLSEFIQYYHDDFELEVIRDGKTIRIPLSASYNEEMKGYTIGIVSTVSYSEIKWYEAFKYGSQECLDLTTSIYRSLAILVQGKGLENLSGPVGIYSVTAESTSYGWMSYLTLFAMISLNIGIFNLIPIPALDGGRILILCIERILHRKINQSIIQGIILASFVLLFGIMIFATYNDVLRLLM